MEKNIELALYYERAGEDFYFARERERDLEQAKRYFRLAVQYGVGEVRAEALCNLALLTEDIQAKLALYMEAVDENCAHAMNMVGICIERYGEWGGALGSALDWYSKAAEAGSPCGRYNADQYIRRELPEREMLVKARAEREKKEARDREARLAHCLEAAKAWEGKPAAILYISNVPRSVLNELAYDAAQRLEQSVLLLAEWKNNSVLSCVGFDLGLVGLAQAMDNPYQQGKCWGCGHFTIGQVQKKDRADYCAAVEAALLEINPI